MHAIASGLGFAPPKTNDGGRDDAGAGDNDDDDDDYDGGDDCGDLGFDADYDEPDDDDDDRDVYTKPRLETRIR